MKNRLILPIIALLILATIFSCSDDPADTPRERPQNPWAFRSVLDLKPRIITLALDDAMWVAYSTQNGSMYKAWKGGVNFDGPVYTTHHGPQPTSIGDAYMVNQYENPWKILKGDASESATLDYKGHRFVNDHVQLMYELTSSSVSDPIKVYEEVEAYNIDKVELHRTFITKNVPDNHSVSLDFNVSSIVFQEAITSDGKLELNTTGDTTMSGKKSLRVNGNLILNSNGSTTLNTAFGVGPTITNPLNKDDGFEESEGLPEGAILIARNDCKTCHNKNVKTIGPAYMSVAKKYATNESNIEMLMSKVKTGGTGIWGEQIMNAHPDLSDAHLRAMVSYVLSLDGDEGAADDGSAVNVISLSDAYEGEESNMIPGAATRIYNFPNRYNSVDQIKENAKPIMAGVMPNFDNIGAGDFVELEEDFALVANGYLYVPEDQNIEFRLWSDDGSKLWIDGQEIINHDGPHGTEMKQASTKMTAGYHKFKIKFFQGYGGRFLSFNWKPEGDDPWAVVPSSNIFHTLDMQGDMRGLTLPMANVSRIPGDKGPLVEMHPSFTLSQARPNSFTPKVGGIDFLSDGRMVVSTWDAAGSVFILDNLDQDNPEAINVKLIANGLAEPLGLKVVDDVIYIMQKQEMTRLIDNDGDDIIDEYQTLADDWGVSANFHEFGFGLAEKDGYLYATLATAIEPGGASSDPQIQNRGKAIKVSIKDGSLSYVSSGLRTPNGIGIGYNGEVFGGDNQGDWLPASKIVHIRDGAWFGSRSVDMEGTASMTETPPLVWLPQDEIGNSPSTPLAINVGPFKNQMIHGEVTHGGVKRVFVEEVDGQLQGCVFRFIQGLEAGVNRLAWGPDGALYAGGIGSTGNWGQSGKLWYGLQKIAYNGNPSFEMLAVRAKSNGMEIEFTEPLQAGDGWSPSDYEIKQWYYKPTIEYGGPKMDERELKVKSASVSEDRKKVFLEIDGIQKGHVVYVRLKNHFVSDNSNHLWSTEAWYTMNNIPQNDAGTVKKAPFKNEINALNEAEKAAGWKLLFDGKSLNGWRNFKKQTIGSSWIVDNRAIHLNAVPRKDGGWQVADGGDIITDGEYENFELKLEWKIANCGNSGIMYNVVESEDYGYVWETGPEMQVLDNTCHPDTRYPTHRAGDLYDMIETKYVTVNPAGDWNKIMIRSKDGQVEFWMNGYRVVEFEMHTDKWTEMIANSKFKDMKGFGLAKKGHISLQDHGDKVWYRNIKIREI